MTTTTERAVQDGATVTVDNVDFAYAKSPILRDVTVTLEPGKITSIVGPNGCGKSTLLKSMARILTPDAGVITMDGRSVHRTPSRVVAQRLGLLAQTRSVPEQLSVEDLVRRGRYPHRRAWDRWSTGDQEAVDDALSATGLMDLRTRLVDELSGGQVQRVFLAMALAQQTPVLLLDEPTTYLDLAFRFDVMNVIRRRNAEHGTTVGMVLHDLGDAAQFSDVLVVMKDGQIVAHGDPRDVMTPDVVHDVFGVRCVTVDHPVDGTPLIVPVADNGNTR